MSSFKRDACAICVAKGDIGKCLNMPCDVHNSWFVKKLYETISELNDIRLVKEAKR